MKIEIVKMPFLVSANLKEYATPQPDGVFNVRQHVETPEWDDSQVVLLHTQEPLFALTLRVNEKWPPVAVHEKHCVLC